MPMIRATTIAFLAVSSILFLAPLVSATCDGNPHGWDRTRRCDEYDAGCPELYSGCSVCEGIGGFATGDQPEEYLPAKCTPIATANEMLLRGKTPIKPIFPEKFINTGFHEVQIYVHRDPFCLAQVPAGVSNGTHCYKPQEGEFHFDFTQNALRIDYIRASTTVPGVNMTEHFHHIDNSVHPEITNFGPLGVPICPCIDVAIGPVTPYWAKDASYVGRESMGIEFLLPAEYGMREVDHWVKGPHHVWVDVETKNIVRLWQPFNGLEVFDPREWKAWPEEGEDLRTLPTSCNIGDKFCIHPYGNSASLELQLSDAIKSAAASAVPVVDDNLLH